MEREKNLAAFLEGNHVDVPKTLLHVTDKDVKSFSADNGIAAWAAGKEFADDFARSKFLYWKTTHLPWEKQPAPPNQNGKAWLNYMPVHISAKNPFDARKLIPDLSKDLTNIEQINSVANKLKIHPQNIYDAIEKTVPNALGQQIPRKLLAADILNNKVVLNKLRELGHDSLIAHEFDQPVFAVFDPSQIKSATGNQGTYDPNDPDITKAEGGSVDEDGITAYHGSPHDFDKFDISKIGTGEGMQSYGHGLYFAQNEDVAKGYRDRLAGHIPGAVQIGDEKHPHWATRDVAKAFTKLGYDPQTSVVAAHLISEAKGDLNKAGSDVWDNPNVPDSVHDALMNAEFATPAGKMYEVKINAHPDHFLDWDKPLHEQPYVMDKLIKAGAIKPDGSLLFMYNEAPSRGGEMYERLTSPMAEKLTGGKSQKHASDFLHGIGIKGIKYFDAGSRGAGEGSRNYVVFDDKLVSTKRKYARGGIVNA